MKEYLGESQAGDLDYMSKLIFTNAEPQVVATLTGGIAPKNIDKLSSKSGHFRFFTKEVSIKAEPVGPNAGDDGDYHQLSPKMHQLKIANT